MKNQMALSDFEVHFELQVEQKLGIDFSSGREGENYDTAVVNNLAKQFLIKLTENGKIASVDHSQEDPIITFKVNDDDLRSNTIDHLKGLINDNKEFINNSIATTYPDLNEKIRISVSQPLPISQTFQNTAASYQSEDSYQDITEAVDYSALSYEAAEHHHPSIDTHVSKEEINNKYENESSVSNDSESSYLSNGFDTNEFDRHSSTSSTTSVNTSPPKVATEEFIPNALEMSTAISAIESFNPHAEVVQNDWSQIRKLPLFSSSNNAVNGHWDINTDIPVFSAANRDDVQSLQIAAKANAKVNTHLQYLENAEDYETYQQAKERFATALNSELNDIDTHNALMQQVRLTPQALDYSQITQSTVYPSSPIKNTRRDSIESSYSLANSISSSNSDELDRRSSISSFTSIDSYEYSSRHSDLKDNQLSQDAIHSQSKGSQSESPLNGQDQQAITVTWINKGDIKIPTFSSTHDPASINVANQMNGAIEKHLRENIYSPQFRYSSANLQTTIDEQLKRMQNHNAFMKQVRSAPESLQISPQDTALNTSNKQSSAHLELDESKSSLSDVSTFSPFDNKSQKANDKIPEAYFHSPLGIEADAKNRFSATSENTLAPTHRPATPALSAAVAVTNRKRYSPLRQKANRFASEVHIAAKRSRRYKRLKRKLTQVLMAERLKTSGGQPQFPKGIRVIKTLTSNTPAFPAWTLPIRDTLQNSYVAQLPSDNPHCQHAQRSAVIWRVAAKLIPDLQNKLQTGQINTIGLNHNAAVENPVAVARNRKSR